MEMRISLAASEDVPIQMETSIDVTTNEVIETIEANHVVEIFG